MQIFVLVLLILILIGILLSPKSSSATKKTALARLKRTVSGSLTKRPPGTVDDSSVTVEYTIQFNGMNLTANSKFHDTLDVDVIFTLGGHVGAKFGDGSRRVDLPINKSDGTATTTLKAINNNGDYLQVWYIVTHQSTGASFTIQGEKVDFETYVP